MKLSELQNLYSNSILSNVDSPFQNQIMACGNLSLEEVTSVYKQAYIYRLKEVMYDNFESVLYVLGEQSFELIIENYIEKNHHLSYDLSNYGKSFPDFLTKSFPELPFLRNLAEFEIHFSECFHKKDNQSFDFSSIRNQEELENSVFEFSDSTKLIQNQFAIYSIWKNRKSSSPPDLSNLNHSEQLLLYKRNSNLYVLLLEPVEFFFIDLLQKGKSIVVALEKISSRFELSPEIVSDLFGKISNSGIVKNIIFKNDYATLNF
ncbi:putative DNA-binding domain-containing protein [Leptospira meyeri]|uniref:HvfC/BufC family peptide modification chaperone n=1 Tax=Leptospira meyeri TaxID=29508 RepID=UPI000C2A842F|nr:putative DNA-binding domain-containing protein [Leptospira meyeri]PKA22352.1 DUF2063 domain-containing protein [Leptospira sp. mixed culture ATI2-C-A1]MCW7488519.1 DNA-binding domain-containing protein [Leptospira meyeri]PJZ81315.1 DUF2063 domain-containing protein [Leptospira meyeri]PJZ96821.1 DUF2063 domain-containing protein [Leptospira meyeri]PKA11222.1 DUF2063 domain-containing protein [Leptospira meyeri]